MGIEEDRTQDPIIQHLRFWEAGHQLTWKETLEAMCRYYGTFRGRWHENWFWKETLDAIPSMTESQCCAKILQIEREAEADLAYWRAMG